MDEKKNPKKKTNVLSLRTHHPTHIDRLPFVFENIWTLNEKCMKTNKINKHNSLSLPLPLPLLLHLTQLFFLVVK